MASFNNESNISEQRPLYHREGVYLKRKTCVGYLRLVRAGFPRTNALDYSRLLFFSITMLQPKDLIFLFFPVKVLIAKSYVFE